MWYLIWDEGYNARYAVSNDGVHWEKPNLGIYPEKGLPSNRIFPDKYLGGNVLHTPWDKPDRRYKLVVYDYGRDHKERPLSGLYGALSPDGIHWRPAEPNPLVADPGDCSYFDWDPRRRRYYDYTKVFVPVRGFSRRSVGITASLDFATWPSAQFILSADLIDDTWGEGGDNRMELYFLTAFVYESHYIGFLCMFPITDGDNDGPLYLELVTSMDGVTWTRQTPEDNPIDLKRRGNAACPPVRRMPILPLGEEGAWDDGMVFSVAPPRVEGDLLRLWYTGINITHGARGASGTAAVGLATLRKDGFVSLEASAQGEVTTKPLRGLQGHLLINADVRQGTVQVEVLDSNGQALPGYGRDECSPVAGADGCALPVSWGDHTTLPESGVASRLRFVLDRARLYSFRCDETVTLAEEALPIRRVYRSPAQTEAKKGPVAVENTLPAEVLSTSPGGIRLAQGKDGTACLELPDSMHLGASFTLAARLIPTADKEMRFFTNYRGTGEIASGELVFDYAPERGLRLVVNGQPVVSAPLRLELGRSHDLAATYHEGAIVFWVNGEAVGNGEVLFGAKPIRSKNARDEKNGVLWPLFAHGKDLPGVGIHLGSNLRFGADRLGRFFNYGKVDLGGYYRDLGKQEQKIPADTRFEGVLPGLAWIEAALDGSALDALFE